LRASSVHACLPHIYGSIDFENNRERILKQHALEDMDYEILVCTPRRWGKTVSVSMWCASLLYHGKIFALLCLANLYQN
jgi:hypothetical protein